MTVHLEPQKCRLHDVIDLVPVAAEQERPSSSLHPPGGDEAPNWLPRWQDRRVRIRIEGYELPRLTSPMSIGLQVRQQVEQVQPAGVPDPIWTADADVVTKPDGTLDLRGPAIHGRPGDRFLYLTWLRSEHGVMAGFRHAKLMLDAVDPSTLQAAARATLVARVGLTGKDGTPRCAAVRPPSSTWSAEPT